MSKERIKELEYFCLQYREKSKLSNLNTLEGRKAKIDVILIDNIAAVVYPKIKDYIIENVTTGKTWEQLNPPCGRRQFYEARKEFFDMLSKYR